MPEAKNVTKTTPEEGFKKPSILNTSHSSSDSTSISPHLHFNTFQIHQEKPQENARVLYQPPKTNIKYVKHHSYQPHSQYHTQVENRVSNSGETDKYSRPSIPESFYGTHNDHYKIKISPDTYPSRLNGNISHESQLQNSNLNPDGPKKRPAVGTSEWLKLRRENHKQVERKRREGINDTIKHLSELVPGAEKHKGGILNRVVDYINKQQKEFEKLNEEHNQEISSLKNHINKLTFELNRVPNNDKDIYTNGNPTNGNSNQEIIQLRAEISELKAHLKQAYTNYDTLDRKYKFSEDDSK